MHVFLLARDDIRSDDIEIVETDEKQSQPLIYSICNRVQNFVFSVILKPNIPFILFTKKEGFVATIINMKNLTYIK